MQQFLKFILLKLAVVGLVITGPTTTNSTAITTFRKTETDAAVVELLMMGVRKPEAC
jgi:hypothetical protein